MTIICTHLFSKTGPTAQTGKFGTAQYMLALPAIAWHRLALPEFGTERHELARWVYAGIDWHRLARHSMCWHWLLRIAFLTYVGKAGLCGIGCHRWLDQYGLGPVGIGWHHLAQVGTPRMNCTGGHWLAIRTQPQLLFGVFCSSGKSLRLHIPVLYSWA